MTVKKSKIDKEKPLSLVTQTPEQKRMEITDLLAKVYLMEHECESIKGQLKQKNNDIKALKEQMKGLVLDVEAGQLKLIIDQSEDRDIFDQSNITEFDDEGDGAA